MLRRMSSLDIVDRRRIIVSMETKILNYVDCFHRLRHVDMTGHAKKNMYTMFQQNLTANTENRALRILPEFVLIIILFKIVVV